MWFKNLYLFKFETAFALSAEDLHEALSTKLFAGCSATQRESVGWGFPMGKGTSSTTHSVNGNILLSMIRQERILPADVIKEAVHEKVDQIEEKESRKVSSREKKEIKEDVEYELLPRAFTRTVQLEAWIDRKGEWLIVNTSSAPRAEDFTKLLRKTLGSLAVTLPQSEITPAVAMTEWLSMGKTPEPFGLGYECRLKNQGDDKGKASYSQHDLTLDEIASNLQTGKFVSELALEWDEKISFVLNENLVIKKLKFLDVVQENLNDNDPQTHAEHKDIMFTIMAGEVESLLADLFKVLSHG